MALASVPMPPIRRSPLGVPSALAPWQAAHFAAKTCAPCATDPEPAGSPLPSGGMLISAFVSSSGVAGRPYLGGATWAAKAMLPAMQRTATETTPLLNIDIAHLAVGGDIPALDGVEVKILPR